MPSATLLLKLALATDRWAVAWEDVDALKDFKVADLACGTGTLLMAASQALTDNFIRCSAQAGRPVNDEALRELHRALMENLIHGYDVLPSAVHLTASTLALLAPEIAFRSMRLYSLPLGKVGRNLHLGSIDFLGADSLQTQFDLMGKASDEGGSVTGKGLVASKAPLPDLDLCVMNPPFVRSVGGNLLFGSLPLDRSAMQEELRKLVGAKDDPVQANTTAGLGSVFTAIGDRHLKPGGRLALVLPAAVTTGIAWGTTRALIEQKYDLEILIASYEADRWNFSENTDLSEVLLVAHKRESNRNENEGKAIFVNLWRNPSTSAESLGVADAISRTRPADIGDDHEVGHGVSSLMVGDRKYGEMLAIPNSEVSDKPWIGCAFAQTELVRAAWYLWSEGILLPGAGEIVPVKLTQLGKVVALGPDRRDIYDGFERTSSPSNYPALWSHNANEMTSVSAATNTFLLPRAKPAPGRPERPVELLWPKAGQIMIAERMRLNSQRTPAVRLQEKALSNVWWPARLKAQDCEEKTLRQREKALVLWLNSSLGILLLIASRVPTEGAWVSFKKPTLEEVPVFDILALQKSDLGELEKTFDEVSSLELRPLAEIATDHVRARIDAAFAGLLGVSSFRPFAEMLGREPVLTNIPLLPQPRTAESEPAQEQLSLF